MTTTSLQQRTSLPQLGNRLFLTDGGIETTLIYHHGIDLPEFAAFVLLEDKQGREELRRGDVGPLPQQRGVVLDRDRVQVGDEVERLEVVLQRDPLAEGTEEVAEVERVRRRLDA